MGSCGRRTSRITAAISSAATLPLVLAAALAGVTLYLSSDQNAGPNEERLTAARASRGRDLERMNDDGL